MSTDYHFICHDCKVNINMGRWGDAMEVIDKIVDMHQGHNINTAEDSDGNFEYNTYEYQSVYNDNDDKIKAELITKEPVIDFSEFYKKHRVPY